MSFRNWQTYRGLKKTPECLFCDIPSKPTIILSGYDYIVRGWRCPKCGFTLIHPNEIQKALELLREISTQNLKNI